MKSDRPCVESCSIPSLAEVEKALSSKRSTTIQNESNCPSTTCSWAASDYCTNDTCPDLKNNTPLSTSSSINNKNTQYKQYCENKTVEAKTSTTSLDKLCPITGTKCTNTPAAESSCTEDECDYFKMQKPLQMAHTKTNRPRQRCKLCERILEYRPTITCSTCDACAKATAAYLRSKKGEIRQRCNRCGDILEFPSIISSFTCDACAENKATNFKSKQDKQQRSKICGKILDNPTISPSTCDVCAELRRDYAGMQKDDKRQRCKLCGLILEHSPTLSDSACDACVELERALATVSCIAPNSESRAERTFGINHCDSAAPCNGCAACGQPTNIAGVGSSIPASSDAILSSLDSMITTLSKSLLESPPKREEPLEKDWTKNSTSASRRTPSEASLTKSGLSTLLKAQGSPQPISQNFGQPLTYNGVRLASLNAPCPLEKCPVNIDQSCQCSFPPSFDRTDCVGITSICKCGKNNASR